MAQNPPFFQPFLFCVSEVTIHNNPQRAGRSTPNDRYWVPPADKEEFSKQQPPQWRVWNPGQRQSLHGFRHLHRPTTETIRDFRHTRTCSVFWDPERHGYVLVPYDCTRISDCETSPFNWRRLSFGQNNTHPDRRIALVGYEMTSHNLPFAGPQSWFDQLLSDVYRGQGAGNGHNCGLAGNLAVLIALIAFSANRGDAYAAVDQSFRPDISSTTLRPHGHPVSHRNLRRGIIVEIRVQDETVLRNWEMGMYGPIFT
ncbi:hypothetical protein PV08_03010 [Exophiala spinifera]|uniref:Uncharacterized protein n=1 Tax=Exophiala spinifera TaxID=91928 RepID=A0A0D1YTY2_9EURO|nr:uncharacterized protein PV08_03010 [Exophiala spinifera]KIW18721.1 hypothetical protein PV08_03010 [Exophiala spinifera]